MSMKDSVKDSMKDSAKSLYMISLLEGTRLPHREMRFAMTKGERLGSLKMFPPPAHCATSASGGH